MTVEQCRCGKPVVLLPPHGVMIHADGSNGHEEWPHEAERKALDALDGDLGSAYWAEISPPVHELAELLAKHGWVYSREEPE